MKYIKINLTTALSTFNNLQVDNAVVLLYYTHSGGLKDPKSINASASK